jgi:hypothetical protein
VRLEPPQKLGGPLLIDDHGDEVLVIPYSPVPTIKIAFHAEHGLLLLTLRRRA